jgi:TRAP-type mannitol/chloroaromatic compound transport system permease large subunit
MWRAYERLDETASWWDSTSLWIEGFLNNRIFDLFINQSYTVMSNEVLTAIPLFLFMGYVVERSNIVDKLFGTLNIAAKGMPGSMGVAALFTCALFATATGIVGAVVTLMGLLALPQMLKARYSNSFAAGIICAGGTLGILIPPSIMLIVYAAASGVSIVRLYAGALVPGFTLVGFYLVYVIGRAILQPSVAPRPTREEVPDVPIGTLSVMLLRSFLPLALLILSVLGSILFGLATPTEAAAIGAMGGLLLAVAYRAPDLAAPARERLPHGAHHGDGVLAFHRLLHLLGGVLLPRRRAGHLRVRSEPRPHAHCSSCFWRNSLSSCWAGVGMVRNHHHLRANLPAAAAPLRYRPLFFGILVALNLQTSFLTPPMAMSAYYLKGIAPEEVSLAEIFRGCLPFVGMVFLCMMLMYAYPSFVFALPEAIYGR